MSNGTDSSKLSIALSEIQNRLEDLRTRCISDSGNAREILSDALKHLQDIFEEMNTADKETVQQNDELMRNQLPLQESKEELGLVADGIPTLLAHISADLRYLFVNSSYANWLGLASSEIIGRHVSEILPKEGFEAALPHIERVLSGEEVTSNLAVTIDDQQRYQDRTLIPQFDESGTVVAYYVVAKDVTERKQAEESLRQSQSMLARAEKIANIGSWEWDIKSGKQIWSEQTYRIFDMDPGKYIPTYELFLAYVHPDYRQFVVQAIEDALSGKKPYDIEYQIILPSSITRWAHSMGEFVFDENGRTISMIGVMLEITERKRAEAELQKAKSDLEQRVLERTEELSRVNLAIQAEIVERKRAEEMMCLQRDLGISLSATGDLKEALNLILNACLRVRGIDCGGIYMVDEKLGDLRLVAHTDTGLPRQLIEHSNRYDPGSLQARLIMSGEPIYASYSWISSASSEVYPMENLRAISIIPVKCREKVTAMLTLASRTLDEIPLGIRSTLEAIAAQVGGAIERLKAEEDRKQAQEQVRFQASLLDQVRNAVIATDLQGTILYWNRFAEDLHQWKAEEVLGKAIAETIVPEDKSNRIHGVMAQLKCLGHYEHNLLLRRKDGTSFPAFNTYSVLKDIKGEHIGYVGVSTDLTEHNKIEQDLRLAKEQAETAARAKSEFLANMSHEIRTPMNAVIGMAGILLDMDLTPEQLDCVQTIRSSGDALLSIINDILDFSKIEGGKMEIEHSPFNLAKFIESSMDLIAGRASEKGLNLAYFLADDVPTWIYGDITRLRQVLINLLSNAVKFTDKGDVGITVNREDADLLHFAVKDTGIGIHKDKMDRLFQSFTQADSSTTKRFGGTGLGLSISKRLVELMGGRIWAESIPGEGSIFHFTIRAEAASACDAQMVGRRVLVIEEGDGALSQSMRSWGITITNAASGAEALDIISRGEPVDAVVIGQVGDADAAASKISASFNLPVVLSDGTASSARGFDNLKGSLVEALVQHPRKENAQEGQAGPSCSRPISILVAEDNIVNRKVALLMLKKLGYSADVAANGIEVLSALERQPYDVILMDVQMPEMDGLEATRAIRRNYPTALQPKILAMTAYALEGDRETCINAGMDGYITKPMQKEDLAEILAKYGQNAP